MQIRVELSAHRPSRSPVRSAASPPPAAKAALGTPAGGEAPLTVDAMRAAVLAIRAGVFDRGCVGADGGGRHAEVLAACSPPPGVWVPWRGSDAAGAAVLVLAGHAGAGASMVALALGEALAADRPALLVEYAEPLRSGLAAACSSELGLDGAGWRRGRRGRLDVGRLGRPQPVSELPRPPQPDGADRLLVVDLGWALTAALLHADPGEWLTADQRVVVVTRLTVPGVRQTEQLLAALGPQACGGACVAAVGPNRWPRGVEANYGPNLATLASDGRLVRIPMESRLEGSGLTADPLPKSVATAGRALAAALLPSAPGEAPR